MKDIKILKECLQDKIQEIADNLIENNPEAYDLGKDTDYVDVGIGSVCVRSDTIYDEDAAYKDAREKFAESVENYDSEEYLLELLENDTFRNTLANMIRRL